jgi:hypothetical protein
MSKFSVLRARPRRYKPRLPNFFRLPPPAIIRRRGAGGPAGPPGVHTRLAPLTPLVRKAVHKLSLCHSENRPLQAFQYFYRRQSKIGEQYWPTPAHQPPCRVYTVWIPKSPKWLGKHCFSLCRNEFKQHPFRRKRADAAGVTPLLIVIEVSKGYVRYGSATRKVMTVACPTTVSRTQWGALMARPLTPRRCPSLPLQQI